MQPPSLPANLVNLMSSGVLGKTEKQSSVTVEAQLTPAQRQAEAKQALRKQLEKTLLQVNPFKFKINFLN